MQREPSRFVAHDLHEHDAAVAARGRLDAADCIGGDFHRRLEPEGEIRTVDIVIDRLGNADHVAALHAQQRRRLVRARAAQRKEAVQPHFFIVCDHSGEPRAPLFGRRHLLERLTGSAQDGAADVEDIRKILLRERIALPADEPADAI